MQITERRFKECESVYKKVKDRDRKTKHKGQRPHSSFVGSSQSTPGLPFSRFYSHSLFNRTQRARHLIFESKSRLNGGRGSDVLFKDNMRCRVSSPPVILSNPDLYASNRGTHPFPQLRDRSIRIHQTVILVDILHLLHHACFHTQRD